MIPVSPLAAGLAGLAGTMLLQHFAGGPPTPRTFGQSPTEGAAAALAGLPASAGGVAIPKAANGSTLDTFRAQREALVKKFGSDGYIVPYPAAMQLNALRDVVDGWLRAFDAGRDASDDTKEDFALARWTAGSVSAAVDRVIWEELKAGGDPFDRLGLRQTDLGRYALALLQWRKVELDPLSSAAGVDWSQATSGWPATTAVIRGTFDRLVKFVGGIEGVTYVFPHARPSEQGTKPSDVAGAAGAAAAASGNFVANVAAKGAGIATDIAGAAVGAIVRAVLGSPVFWIAAGGVTYYVLVGRE